jgi:hypothetical protein
MKEKLVICDYRKTCYDIECVHKRPHYESHIYGYDCTRNECDEGGICKVFKHNNKEN